MRRSIRLFAACLAGCLAGAALAPAPGLAFDALWFTQRGKKLRAGASDDHEVVPRRPGARPMAPRIEHCGQAGAARGPAGEHSAVACE